MLCDQEYSDVLKTKKVLVIANRLPLTCKVLDSSSKDGYSVMQSSGGLVSALKGVHNLNAIWLGWPGTSIPEIQKESFEKKCSENCCIPIYLPSDIANKHYNGYCNEVIWPILHYVVAPSLDDLEEIWNSYIQANEIFADAVVNYINAYNSDNVSDEVIIWVHDYHLMLLPQFIRERLPNLNLSISFFLHTPFPHKNIWNVIARGKEILTGLMYCNSVGFHIYEYQKHFMQACEMLLAVEIINTTLDASAISNLTVHCFSCPIGIDPEMFISMSTSDEIKLAAQSLRERYNNRVIVISVDRLDYMKGVYQKLCGILRFIEKYPELKNDIVFIQLAVPSRQEVPAYKRFRSKVHQMVALINGMSTDAPIIEHWDQSLSTKELITVYTASDICLITSIRDGMNLVAFEYVATQTENMGILLLSEFAGAERSLAHGVISFNPWSPDAIADSINEALCMNKNELKNKHKWAFNHVKKHTAEKWASQIITDLTTKTSLKLSTSSSSLSKLVSLSFE